MDTDLEGSYVNISEFHEKLSSISQSLPESDLSAVGFLCQAVCPKSCIYPTTIHKVPSVAQCYHGLCRHSDTQAIAVSIILYVLDLVGARNDSEELQRVANENQIERDGAHVRKVDGLSVEAKEMLHFRELLVKIYRQLPDDDKLAVINLSSSVLHPPRHPSYTQCLLVHFMVMMQGKIISPNDVKPLHECLLIIGQGEIIDLINSYCADKGLSPLPTRKIERRDAKKRTTPASAGGATPASVATPRLDCVVDPDPHPTRPTVVAVDPPTDSSDRVEQGIFPHSTQESGLGEGGLLVSHKGGHKEYATPDGHEGRGGGFRIFTTDTVRDDPSHKPDVPKVKFLETRRLSQRLAYVKWEHKTPQNAKYTVEVVPSRKGNEKEVVTLKTETESNEFVAGGLEGDKEYIVTISTKSPEGNITASGTHTIPLPREEYVSIPQGVTVTPEKGSLVVQWEKVQQQTGAEGYSVMYYPTTEEARKEMKDVDGVTNTSVVLNGLQPSTAYSIQVAVRMSGDVVGPYSNPETGMRKTSKKRSAIRISLSIVFWLFFLATLIVSGAVLADYSTSSVENRTFNITPGDTIDLGVYSAFRYDTMEVSSERVSTLTVYLRDTECNNLPVHANTSFGYETSFNLSTTETTTMGVNPANGYFAHTSMPSFQLNTSGPLLLTNCSAAFYFFNNPSELDDFRFFRKTTKSIGRICFNVVNNTLDFNNTSVDFLIKSSTYLYIGLYLHGVTHISLHISGTQNVYRHTDFANSTRCVIDPDTPDCSFPLPCSLGHTSNDVCVLAYWESSPGEMRQLITTQASYDVSPTFPQNIAQLLSLVFGILSLVGLVGSTIACIVCACIYCR